MYLTLRGKILRREDWKLFIQWLFKIILDIFPVFFIRSFVWAQRKGLLFDFELRRRYSCIVQYCQEFRRTLCKDCTALEPACSSFSRTRRRGVSRLRMTLWRNRSAGRSWSGIQSQKSLPAETGGSSASRFCSIQVRRKNSGFQRHTLWFRRFHLIVI